MIHQLTRDDLVTILTEPRNALVKQFQRFFQFDGIELVFADDSLQAIADKALERETGARGLRSILEETLLDVQFELPSRRDVKKCVVTKETIEKGLKPTLVTEAAPDEDTASSTPSRPSRVGLAGCKPSHPGVIGAGPCGALSLPRSSAARFSLGYADSLESAPPGRSPATKRRRAFSASPNIHQVLIRPSSTRTRCATGCSMSMPLSAPRRR